MSNVPPQWLCINNTTTKRCHDGNSDFVIIVFDAMNLPYLRSTPRFFFNEDEADNPGFTDVNGDRNHNRLHRE